MKSIFCLFTIFTISVSTSFAQVGINTETPDPSSILDLNSDDSGLLLPRLNDLQRDAIADPATGLMIFNTDKNGIELNTGTSAAPNWNLLASTEGSKTLTLYRDLGVGSNNITGDGSFVNFPLGTSNITEIDNDFFTVLSNGKIRLEQEGSYQINASWAVQNLSSGTNGTRKYIFAVFRGAERLGYLTRGFAAIPGPASNTEYFGASGSFQFFFEAGDVIDIQYWIDNSGSPLDGDLLHIGLKKL